MLSDPPLCYLNQLEDGTYSLYDFYLLHELLDLRAELSKK